MQITATKSGSMPSASPGTAVSHPWLRLISRAALFLLIQGLIALIFAASGRASPWDESARSWTFIATFANFAS